LNFNGNYTLSHCESDTDVSGNWIQYDAGYLKPDDPSFDRGNCLRNVSQIANVSLGVETPRFANVALRSLASNWRIAGILNARSGNWLTATTNLDTAGIGLVGQRVNQLLENPYGDKSVTNYLNRSAFAQPAPGTLGDHRSNSIEGPGYWTIDVALSRFVNFAASQRVEIRLEAFNLLNHLNLGSPQTNFNSAAFGRITAITGAPRVMQVGFKYEF
jgi:hypothetical protein